MQPLKDACQANLLQKKFTRGNNKPAEGRYQCDHHHGSICSTKCQVTSRASWNENVAQTWVTSYFFLPFPRTSGNRDGPAGNIASGICRSTHGFWC